MENLVNEKSKRLSFRKGSGEFIGAAVVLPMIFVIILFLINIFQIAMCEQKLIFAAYSCGRQAVISYDYDTAVESAGKRLSQIYPEGSNVQVHITPEHAAWLKGNVIEIAVEQKISTFLGIQSGVHTRYVAMMIEHSKWGGD